MAEMLAAPDAIEMTAAIRANLLARLDGPTYNPSLEQKAH
jgi:hypothetical protein